MPRYTDEQRAEMVDLYRSGLGYARVAERFGCSHNTVAAAVRAAGVKPKTAGGQRRLSHRYGTWSRRTMANGYVAWSAWDAERKRPKWLLEHRIVMSWILGRELRPGENVHHRDGDRANNDPTNLELWVRPQPSGASHCPKCGEPFTAGPAC